jgi:hypothetical protein
MRLAETATASARLSAFWMDMRANFDPHESNNLLLQRYYKASYFKSGPVRPSAWAYWADGIDFGSSL